MAGTQKGLGVVFGVDNMTITGAIVNGTTGALLQSLELTRDSDVAYGKDYQGNTRAVVFSDKKKRGTITVLPSGTSVAAAQTSYDAWMQAAGVTITVGADGSFIDGGSVGKFNVLSTRASETNTGIATVAVEVESFDDNDVTAAIA